MTTYPGDNMTGTQLKADPGFQREALAQRIVNNLFPGLKSSHPKQFIADTTFLYDMETSNTTWDVHHPFSLAATGVPESAAWLKAHQANVVKALAHGDVSTARKAEERYRSTPVGTSSLPFPLDPKSGDFKEDHGPGLLGQIGDTITGLPGAAASDAGSAAGGIGKLLGDHMVLVILVVALVLVMKK